MYGQCQRLWMMHGSALVKRELSIKAKLSIYWLVHVPTFTYCNELWVVAKEWDCGYKWRKLTFSEGWLTSPLETREVLRVELLILHNERSQLRSSDKDAPWVRCFLHVQPGGGTGQTQHTLERLYLSAGLRTPWCSSGKARGNGWEEGISWLLCLCC